MAYQLPELPYAYDALEPHIDAQTMEIHHDKHHAAYVDEPERGPRGNRVDGPPHRGGDREPRDPPGRQAGARPQQRRRPREPLALLGDALRKRRRRAGGALGEAVQATFGAFDVLKQQMVDAGIKRFGSGWSWLVWDGTGLAVMSTPNQDSPIMEGKTPLFGIDVWEHAYYLKYQNRRPEYLEAIWNVVAWDAVGARFEAARG